MSTASAGARKRPRRQARPARERHSEPFIWREALWVLDWLSLRLSPVYLGLGVPRGDGSPVVLVPGFMTTDAYLVEMYCWLRRTGYAPHFSGIGVNAGCFHTLTDRLEKTVAGVHDDTGRPVRIIGHSLGGSLARRVALRRPEIVSHVISLAAPIQSLEAHPAVMNAAGWARAYAAHPQPQDWLGARLREDCECHADHCVPSPPSSVRRAAIYSRDDGVIDWRNCLEPDPSLNHEVGGTHIGLAFNPCVYRIIAKLLAQTGSKSSPGPAKRAGLKAA
jgi:pimeloyl-ACP methyl ester carboxylesterase